MLLDGFVPSIFDSTNHLQCILISSYISNHWYATKKVTTHIGFSTTIGKSKMHYVALLAYPIKKNEKMVYNIKIYYRRS